MTDNTVIEDLNIGDITAAFGVFPLPGEEGEVYLHTALYITRHGKVVLCAAYPHHLLSMTTDETRAFAHALLRAADYLNATGRGPK